MTLQKATQLLKVQADFGGFYNANGAKLILAEVSRAAELWNQRSYLARVVSMDRSRGIVDEGILPLQHFVDTNGPDAVAVVLETDPAGDHHPAVYLRRDGKVTEHVLPGDPLYDFETASYRAQFGALLQDLI